jgi:hypothetical protein
VGAGSGAAKRAGAKRLAQSMRKRAVERRRNGRNDRSCKACFS